MVGMSSEVSAGELKVEIKSATLKLEVHLRFQPLLVSYQLQLLLSSLWRDDHLLKADALEMCSFSFTGSLVSTVHLSSRITDASNGLTELHSSHLDSSVSLSDFYNSKHCKDELGSCAFSRISFDTYVAGS